MVDRSKWRLVGPMHIAETTEQARRNVKFGLEDWLIMATNWADWAQTKRSYELFSRYVMPCFQGRNRQRSGSMEWTVAKRSEFQGDYTAAITKEITDYAGE